MKHSKHFVVTNPKGLLRKRARYLGLIFLFMWATGITHANPYQSTQ
ncbi:MAG: hypothetical protein LBU84_09925 [Prevotella sp.]|nr:hypothetical protein [Prevotella sp.]